MDHNVAGGTPAAVEEVLHDAAFANWEEVKPHNIRQEVKYVIQLN